MPIAYSERFQISTSLGILGSWDLGTTVNYHYLF
jgi:hypothetical protein